jgi:hypothetical protein
MSEEHATAVVQRYLNELGGDSPVEPIVCALLDRSVRRLEQPADLGPGGDPPGSM